MYQFRNSREAFDMSSFIKYICVYSVNGGAIFCRPGFNQYYAKGKVSCSMTKRSAQDLKSTLPLRHRAPHLISSISYDGVYYQDIESRCVIVMVYYIIKNSINLLKCQLYF